MFENKNIKIMIFGIIIAIIILVAVVFIFINTYKKGYRMIGGVEEETEIYYNMSKEEVDIFSCFIELTNNKHIDKIISNDETENYWRGNIDEVRISNIARNANWITTSYNTMTNTTTFVTIGSEQSQ